MNKKGKVLVTSLVVFTIALLFVASISNSVVVTAKNDENKTKNTPCARECTMQCTPNSPIPKPGAENLSVNDCIHQCLSAVCNQAVNTGNCDAISADECCNIFATPGQDPDCCVQGIFEEIVSIAPGFQESASIYENKVVYHDYRANNFDIYLYDIASKTETRLTTNEYQQLFPRIYGNNVLWVDYRNGTHLYKYDLTTHEETELSSVTSPNGLAIDDNKLVYQDFRNGDKDLYVSCVTIC